MDYIIDKDEEPFLIEINSIPGMSKESIIPQMAKVGNIELFSLFWRATTITALILLALFFILIKRLGA